MSLDAQLFKYMEDSHWRVLTSIEMGQRNHEIVSTELIHQISGIRGTIHHHLSYLARSDLIHHVGKPYDGYHLNKLGYDFLALHALVKRGVVSSLGFLIGQGKEADVYVAYDDNEKPLVLKFHRIGRISFRKAKETREYLSNKHTSSWLYLSRLSARREYQNMKGLHKRGFPVPIPIDHNRHAVVMSQVEGRLLNNIGNLDDPEGVFNEIVNISINLLRIGVIHADLTQFNTIISSDGKVTIIDFPQCVRSTDEEAEEKFNHDLDELRKFFKNKYGLEVESIPRFQDFIDEIVIEDIIGRDNDETPGGEEDVDEEAQIMAKVSKENRYKKKVKRPNEGKKKNRLQFEANASLF